MRGALKQSFSYLAMTSQAGIFDSKVEQLLFRQSPVNNFGEFSSSFISEVRCEALHHVHMMNIVTRQTTHVASVVLPATPVEMTMICRMADKTSFIGFRGRYLRRINRALSRRRAGAILRVFVAVAMTTLTNRRARIAQELSALSMNIKSEGLDNYLVTLSTVSPDYFLLSSRCSRGPCLDRFGFGGLL